jgi:CRISPR-associated protein Cmr1
MNVSRFLNLETIKYEGSFITPAFLGGADGQPELRASSFKAMLRWWWRVLYGSAFPSAQELLAEEKRIFGSTDGAAQVRISLSGKVPIEKGNFPDGKRIEASHAGRSFKIKILDYLAFGVAQYDKAAHGTAYTREHLRQGCPFSLILTVPTELSEILKVTVNAFSAFGSLGSRSRNGFGSISLKTKSPDGHYERDWKTAKPMEFPTVNVRSRLFQTKHLYSTWEDALSDIGILYRSARTGLERKHIFERRSLISRPIEVKGENIRPAVKKDRSPKQFLLHVGRVADGYYGQILTLPVLFYEKQSRDKYDKMLDDMNKALGTQMVDRTARLGALLGAAK